MVLLEVLVSMVILAVALVPMIGFFWKLNPKTNEKFEIDRRLEEAIYIHIQDEQKMNLSQKMDAIGGTRVVQEISWEYKAGLVCINARAIRDNIEISRLARCLPNES